MFLKWNLRNFQGMRVDLKTLINTPQQKYVQHLQLLARLPSLFERVSDFSLKLCALCTRSQNLVRIINVWYLFKIILDIIVSSFIH